METKEILNGQADVDFKAWLQRTGKGRPASNGDMIINLGDQLSDFSKLPEIFKHALILQWFRDAGLKWDILPISGHEAAQYRVLKFESITEVAQVAIIKDGVHFYNKQARQRQQPGETGTF